MEGSCPTGESPQRAVVPVEEEEEFVTWLGKSKGIVVPMHTMKS
jgi:hypothetical protein